MGNTQSGTKARRRPVPDTKSDAESSCSSCADSGESCESGETCACSGSCSCSSKDECSASDGAAPAVKSSGKPKKKRPQKSKSESLPRKQKKTPVKKSKSETLTTSPNAAAPLKPSPEDEALVSSLAASTHFTEEEVFRLLERYQEISASVTDDGVIDGDEFRRALNLQESILVERLFSAFDTDNDGEMTFPEFVKGLSHLSPLASLEEKLQLSFGVFDVDGNGVVDKEELYSMLKASLVEGTLGVDLSETQMRDLVDATFRQVCGEGDGISFDDFAAMVRRNPVIVRNLTVNTDILRAVGNTPVSGAPRGKRQRRFSLKDPFAS
jgi:serine/threonine-protein phosphatase 2B regulatory subunit